MWSAVAQVGSAITLAAFIAAAAAWAFKIKSREKIDLIRTAPAAQRARLVESALESFRIDSGKLTGPRQFELALRQIEARETRFRYSALLVGIIAVLAAGVTAYAIYQDAAGRPRGRDVQKTIDDARAAGVLEGRFAELDRKRREAEAEYGRRLGEAERQVMLLHEGVARTAGLAEELARSDPQVRRITLELQGLLVRIHAKHDPDELSERDELRLRLAQDTLQTLEGSARSPALKALNRLKNRSRPPEDGDFDREVTLAAMLAPGHDVRRFDQRKAAAITGFVIDVKVGGITSANFRARGIDERDTVIAISSAKDAPPNRRVILVVTPRLRAQMKVDGVDWSTEALRDPDTGIKGRRVEVAGWLLFDTAHINQAENTNPGNPTNWRATCWEIHPVTRIRVLDGTPEQARPPAPAAARSDRHARADRVERVRR